MTDGFLPLTRQQADALGWGVPDFVYVTGDAYVDHPSFGTAIISRVLDNAGFKVAILAQPDYRSCDSFKKFGKPRLGFLVTGGNIDSMVAHYTVSLKKEATTIILPEAYPAKDRIALLLYIVTVYARHTEIFQS